MSRTEADFKFILMYWNSYGVIEMLMQW